MVEKTDNAFIVLRKAEINLIYLEMRKIMADKYKQIVDRTRRLIRHFKQSVRISWQASPTLFLIRIIYEAISVAMPIISLYLSRNIINILSSSKYQTQKKEFYFFICLIVLMQLIRALLGRVNGYVSTLHNDLVGNKIDLEIMEQINKLDISYFDNPTFYDDMQNAMRDSKSLQSLTWISLTLIKSIVQMISNLIILIGLSVYLPFVMILCSLPGIFIDKYAAKRKYDWQLQRARNDRKLGYVKNILSTKGTAKDVRIWGIQQYFKDKYLELWDIRYDEKKALERQKLVLSFTASILPLFASTAVLILVGNNIFAGSLTLGDYSLYSGVSTQLLASITTLTGVINQSYESEMRLTKYADFLKTEPLVKNEGTRTLDSVNTIEFRNVTFSYPMTNRVVLRNISFTIHKNESLALVGLNGAGKSTIVKLILRLYDPDDGEILVNGINVKKYDIQSYYKCIGVVFQDFCRYQLKIREAVALSDIDGVDDDERIISACKSADVDLSILKPEEGIDSYLGKTFDPDGVELSGGNWQKIAIAQAYFKNSSLMVFDEPNAALDPDAERRLFEKMVNLSQDKCVVYVTHRLSSATTAGQILVINNGICCERGTHSELMEQKGLYYDLFSKQAEHYRENH